MCKKNEELVDHLQHHCKSMDHLLLHRKLVDNLLLHCEIVSVLWNTTFSSVG
jgi:hypothetical protein